MESKATAMPRTTNPCRRRSVSNPRGSRPDSTKALVMLCVGVMVALSLKLAIQTPVARAEGVCYAREQDRKESFLACQNKLFDECLEGPQVKKAVISTVPSQSDTSGVRGRRCIDESSDGSGDSTQSCLSRTNTSYPHNTVVSAQASVDVDVDVDSTIDKDTHRLCQQAQWMHFRVREILFEAVTFLVTGLILVFAISHLVVKPIVQRMPLVLHVKIDVEEGGQAVEMNPTHRPRLDETPPPQAEDQIPTVSATILPNEEPRARYVRTVYPSRLDAATIPRRFVSAHVFQDGITYDP